jgi:hypothetical protein
MEEFDTSKVIDESRWTYSGTVTTLRIGASKYLSARGRYPAKAHFALRLVSLITALGSILATPQSQDRLMLHRHRY